MHWLTPFCSKSNLCENRIFAAVLTIGGEKGSHNVKTYTENKTYFSWRVDKFLCRALTQTLPHV